MGMGRGERVQTIIFVFQSYVDTRVVRTLECVCIVMHLYVVEPERGDGSASAVSEGGNVHFPPRVGNGLELGGMGRTDRQVPFLSVFAPCLPPACLTDGWDGTRDGATRARRAKIQKKGMRAIIS